jgi:hypothetical protein
MVAHGDLNAEEDIRNNDEGLVVDDHDDVASEVQHLREACQPLYKGAKSSMLTTTFLLMNVRMVHGVSNKFVDELLGLLHKHLLPLDNCLPPTMYVAKTLTSKVGLNYTNIHACVNGCVLFCKQYETFDTYSKCESTQFKEHGQSHVVIKVV